MVTSVAGRGSQLDAVRAHMGDEAATYVGNKARGGSNGSKGTRYENFYAAYKIALAGERVVAGETVWPQMEAQVIGFVDDLRISTAYRTEYVQLKNVEDLSWTSGGHPLEVDFAHQFKFSSTMGEPNPHTALVTSSERVAKKMEKVPVGIEAHTRVEWFPYADGHLNRLVQEHDALRTTLATLSRVTAPTLDALADVFGMLIAGTFMLEGNQLSMEEVYGHVRRLSPSLIRLFPQEMVGFELDPAFVSVLAKIEHLTYGVERGFFQWSAFGTSGVQSFNCLDSKFLSFQKRVVNSAPINFETFEKLLHDY